MPKTFEGTGRTYVTIKANDKGELPSEIKVFPIGRWITEFYGELEITDEHLGQMVKNFDDGVRGNDEIPVDVDHDGGKAAGWFKKLVHKAGDGLYAVVDWTRYGKDLLVNGEYKLFSPEWSFNYHDPLTQQAYGSVLIAGSLTNRPLFKMLPKLVAHDGTGVNQNRDLTKGNTIVLSFNELNTMNATDILKKPVADRTAEEVKFLETAELSDEQKTQLAEEQTQADKEKADAEAKAKADAEAQAQKEKEEAENKTASEDAIKAKEKLEADLKKANETIKALEEKERLTATEKLVSEKYVANANGGKIYPASKEVLVKFLMTASEEQKTQVLTILDALPELKIASEDGDHKNSPLTAKEKFIKLVDEARKADEKLDETSAQRKVRTENPELWKEYQKEDKS